MQQRKKNLNYFAFFLLPDLRHLFCTKLTRGYFCTKVKMEMNNLITPTLNIDNRYN